MRRALRVVLALTPGSVLALAAIAVGGDGVLLPARAAAPVPRPLAAARSVAAGVFATVPLARDPFQPPAGASVERSPEPTATSAARPQAPGAVPVLRALLVGEHAAALLDVAGHSVVARAGEQAGDWRVQAVSPAGVRLARAGAELTLRLEAER
ncbi:hypothetical protein EPN52_02655 [bacterium]|nr:MAG: hypothetical protein EPN52_02655 [bacterium]